MTTTADVRDWILTQGLRGAEIGDLFGGFAERARAAGLSLIRGFCGIQTLHPLYRGVGHVWQLGSPVESDPFPRIGTPPDAYFVSPFVLMIARQLAQLRCSLAPGSEPWFPVFDEFAAQGGTDYVATMISYRDSPNVDRIDFRDTYGDGVVLTWVSDRPGGFGDDELAELESLQRELALAIRARNIEQAATTVMQTYIGRESGLRVLNGQIGRGDAFRIGAVIFFADLRGFTRLADTMDPDDIVAMLDDYLEAIAKPVLAREGEVLKFMGDGLLATFAIGEAMGAEAASARALDAAAEAQADVAALNAARSADGRPTMPLDLALHRGEVLYGNVGAEQRLDFTVIGPAVNEAARLEALCAPLDQTILMSQDFVAAMAPAARNRVRSIGTHALRDVRAPRELFVLAEPS